MLHQIRQLDRSDFQALKELRVAALQDSPEQFGETLFAAHERSDEGWAELTHSTHVAEINGASVGMAFVFDDPKDPAVGRVGGMWVAPGYRRVGVGSALLAAARTWAALKGKRLIRLWVVPASFGAALYERAHFAATGAQRPFPGDETRSVIEMELDLMSGPLTLVRQNEGPAR